MFNHNTHAHGGENIHPTKPTTCPICKEKAHSAAIDIYGPAHDYILELKGTEAEMILLRGWYCSDGMGKKGVFGTVLGHMMPNGNTERYVSHDHCYILFNGDKCSS
ncbi:MAG: hypothetical protein HKM92_08780 [Arenibacter sp.]|nr:hypothetical protein [Arenibacter sp.]